MSDYLWDRSGDPDPEVEQLERSLESLRFRPEPVLTLPEPEAAPRRLPWWRTVALASSTAAAAALLTWWLVRPPHGDAILAEKEVSSVAQLDPKGASDVEVGAAIEADRADDEEEEEEADVVEEVGDGGDLAEGEEEDKVSGKRRSKSTKRSTKSGSKSSGASSSSSSPSTKSGKSSSSLDVDCILNPDLGKCKSGSQPKSGGSSDASLPEKLTTSDIKAGVNGVKGAAKACAARHGAKPGTKVSVKLSITGSTGTVSSASAQSPFDGTPLGNCVAAALKKATFKRFQKSSIGVVYPIRL